MQDKLEEQGFKEFKDAFLATKNYISLGNYETENLYLKNYSTIVSVKKTGKFLDLPGEELLEKSVLENPTEEEKMILATSTSSGLLAIQKGRKILETKSKEEAIEECKTELENIQKKTEEYEHAKTIIGMEENCSESQITIFRQFYGQEYPTLEEAKEIVSKTSFEKIATESKMASLTLGYLDGSLYQEALNMVHILFGLDKTQEKIVVVANEEEAKVEEATEQQEIKEEVTKEASMEEKKEEAQEPVEIPQVKSGEEKEELPSIQIPVVETKEQVETSTVTPATVELPSSTLPDVDYEKMVADVVSGGEPSIPAIQELLNPKAVPIVPENASVSSQDSTVSSAQNQVIAAPVSLEQMVQDINAPSFDGPIGGRTM